MENNLPTLSPLVPTILPFIESYIHFQLHLHVCPRYHSPHFNNRLLSFLGPFFRQLASAHDYHF